MVYKKILIPVDGSETSIKALHEAVKLAKAFNAELRIINVSDEYLGYIEGLSVDLDRYTKSIKEFGTSLLNTMKEVAKKAGVDATTHLIEVKGMPVNVADKIISDAKKQHTDLIVIGTHGRRGFSRLILGSVSDAVIRLADIPVLLVRGEEKE